MANSLYNQINNQNGNKSNLNPQLQAVIKMIKDSGMSPKELFYQRANEMGIDPNEILSMLK